MRYATSGTQQTETVQTCDINDNFNAVSTATKKSDQVPTEVQKTSSDNPNSDAFDAVADPGSEPTLERAVELSLVKAGRALAPTATVDRRS